ncbi:UNKNOWN [Stylonychia lemnae]|uniref:Uncharacterized protein n=1 Tax=Stylonychia lemnae TaxID=5949 RepID=A0A077ZR99_STYLE|nr:UNKNOWN [Stylonychia lemnae]|eukprot:CDW71865.1 UNKNOWN [Stylonychia lemnae]
MQAKFAIIVAIIVALSYFVTDSNSQLLKKLQSNRQLTDVKSMSRILENEDGAEISKSNGNSNSNGNGTANGNSNKDKNETSSISSNSTGDSSTSSNSSSSRDNNSSNRDSQDKGGENNQTNSNDSSTINGDTNKNSEQQNNSNTKIKKSDFFQNYKTKYNQKKQNQGGNGKNNGNGNNESNGNSNNSNGNNNNSTGDLNGNGNGEENSISNGKNNKNESDKSNSANNQTDSSQDSANDTQNTTSNSSNSGSSSSNLTQAEITEYRVFFQDFSTEYKDYYGEDLFKYTDLSLDSNIVLLFQKGGLDSFDNILAVEKSLDPSQSQNDSSSSSKSPIQWFILIGVPVISALALTFSFMIVFRCCITIEKTGGRMKWVCRKDFCQCLKKNDVKTLKTQPVKHHRVLDTSYNMDQTNVTVVSQVSSPTSAHGGNQMLSTLNPDFGVTQTTQSNFRSTQLKEAKMESKLSIVRYHDSKDDHESKDIKIVE